MAIAVHTHFTNPTDVSPKASQPAVHVSPRTLFTGPTRQQAPATDTVKLSLSARIHLLKSEGQDAKQIATNLNVDAATVSSYLNPTTPASSGSAIPSVTASASAPLPAAK